MTFSVWKLYIGGVAMPTPSKVDRQLEKIWSEDVGRAASGRMLGTMVAEKTKFSFSWSCLTFAQAETLWAAVAGTEFVELTITDYSGTIRTYTGYFGELSAGDYSWAGPGLRVVTDVSVSFVEQ